jgi:hypothetical protein
VGLGQSEFWICRTGGTVNFSLGLFFIYFAFFLGYALHMMLQIDAQVKAKNNAAYSRLTVLKQNAFVILGRLGISLVLFWVVRHFPSALSVLLGYIGITINESSSSFIMTLAMSAPGSWMFGYVVDSLLTFIPVLKNYVPSMNGSGTI